MARRGGRAPNPLRPENTRHRASGHAMDAEGRRRPATPASWIIPLLLVVLGVGIVLMGRGKDCLPLLGTPAGDAGVTQVCTTSWAPGTIIAAVICWLAAGFVWFVQHRD